MKQVILVREDLMMPPGKMAAQCCHASVESVMKSKREKVEKWKDEGMAKVVLFVKDKNHLMIKMRGAKSEKLAFSLIKDAGKTFFKEPTVTCLGIGPDEDGKVDRVSGNLETV